MQRIIVSGLCGLALSGCVSIIGPRTAPGCDGYSRRPLNRSMWEWESTTPAAAAVAVMTPALPAAEPAAAEPAPGPPLMRRGDAGGDKTGKEASGPRFDIAASLNACTGERRHG